MITYPDVRGYGHGVQQRSSLVKTSQETSPGICPLENDIRLGPIEPDSCMSVRMRFMALRPGVHTVEMLTLRDIDSGSTLNLRSVMHVVVHEREDQPPIASAVQMEEVSLG